MKVIYKDGGVLDATTLEINGNEIIADEYRIVSIEEIERIEEAVMPEREKKMKKYEITEENALALFEEWDCVGTYIKDGDDAVAELYPIDNTHGVPGVGIMNCSRDNKVTEFLFDSETGEFIEVHDCYDEEEVRRVCERYDITPGAWYAVHNDEEDNDDGCGSYDIEIAKRILKACLTDNPDAHIAVIDPRDDFCDGKLYVEDLFED